MPWSSVMKKFGAGTLQSGSGQPVRNRKQAVAIMMNEKQKANGGNPEYQASPASSPASSKLSSALKGLK